MDNNKRILCFVYKATSELDFLLPLLWKIRRDHDDVDITVLYCVADRQRILRGSKFYSDFFSKIRAREYDFSSFISRSLVKLVNLVSPSSVGTSYWDLQHLDGYSSNKLIRYLRPSRYINKLLDYFFSILINPHDIFSRISPSLIFFAPRGYSFPGKKKLIKYTYKYRRQVVLFPHGPFISNGCDVLNYGGSTTGEKPVPSFCEYWYSLREEQTAKAYPDIAHQIVYVGYPGLDNEWLEYLRREYYIEGKGKKDESNKERIYKCLFIVRKFEKNARDYGVLQYDEFVNLIQSVVTVFKKCRHRIHIIVKPHPSNDFVGLKYIMDNVGYNNWEISSEPNYLLMQECDFVLTVPSTSFLVPLMFGKPVIIIKTSFLDQMKEAWSFMERFFYGSKFLVRDQDSLEKMVKLILKMLVSGNPSEHELIKENVKYFRKYFPDGALNRCLQRLDSYI